MEFLNRLKEPKPILLDGATGTELTRRGVDTGLPLWSANALLSAEGENVLREIHRDYLLAGAEIITTNTFRTHVRTLAPSGNGQRALELTRRAVEIAREAVAENSGILPRFVAGSISTLEGCYLPEMVPPDDECRAEHSERIHHLIECGVDLLLLETFNTIREAVIAAKLATISGTPVIVSFVPDTDGHILSGETFSEAARQLLPLGVVALGVNCGSTSNLAVPLNELRTICGPDFPLIAYGNIGYPDETIGWINTDAEDPVAYCRYTEDWPVKIVGGCCGTTPAHIEKLRAVL